MALELSVTADLLRQETNIEQQLIVEISGIPLVFGAVTVTKLALYGDDIVFGQTGLLYGGIVADPDGRSYISLQGTTNQLTQQLDISKGGIGSVQKFNVTLIDKDQELTRAFQPGVNVSDLLSQEANVYIGFQGGAHPEDSVRIFNGIVTGQEASPGRWRISIDHPDFLKRQDLFTQVTTKLFGNISAGDLTITLDDASNLITPADAVDSYIRIGDELIQYTTITGPQLTGITRGALGTTAAAHSTGDEVTTFYTLSGDPIELALKIMLSDEGNNNFETGIEVSNIVQIDPSTQIANGILFPNRRLKDELGLELGDYISISGDAVPANNFTDRTIAAFVDHPQGQVIVVNGAALSVSVDSDAVAAFRSQWNVLPAGAGCAMKPSQVDVAQHNRMMTLFPSLPPYLLYIKDTITAKDFLAEQIYLPAGFYQVPRKARSSVAATIPPLVLDELVELNDSNIQKAARNAIKRQITKDFFNSVVYKFNVDTLEDEYLAGEIQVSNRSKNRINTGNRSLTITSDGFRDDVATRNYIKSQSKRFADRWQFAAESIRVETNYKTGAFLEVADIVLFGSSGLQIPDINTGSRDFIPRLMEVTNKSLDIRGRCSIELLDTGFGLDGRFGTISMASFIDTGATTSVIPLKKSFGTGEFELERDKWTNFVGQKIRIHSTDFTFDETVTYQQDDPSSLSKIIVDPPLSSAPLEDYVIDLPDYPTSADPAELSKMKSIHCFQTPQVTVTVGISSTVFEVAPADIDKFFTDAYIIVHTDDYSVSSTVDTLDDDVQVISVDTGTNRVTCGDLGFTPAAGYKVDLIGFADEGLPYRLI